MNLLGEVGTNLLSSPRMATPPLGRATCHSSWPRGPEASSSSRPSRPSSTIVAPAGSNAAALYATYAESSSPSQSESQNGPSFGTFNRSRSSTTVGCCRSAASTWIQTSAPTSLCAAQTSGLELARISPAPPPKASPIRVKSIAVAALDGPKIRPSSEQALEISPASENPTPSAICTGPVLRTATINSSSGLSSTKWPWDPPGWTAVV
mmetsp:Transcript_2941/g.10172  ORF Transcript_2941/g.10172 Transcript_2941/m.10172 type:complete len:208 (+) Transcript_2941:1290-1913(+)